MHHIPTIIAASALAYCMYLFYRHVIVPEQQVKRWRQERYRYRAN